MRQVEEVVEPNCKRKTRQATELIEDIKDVLQPNHRPLEKLQKWTNDEKSILIKMAKEHTPKKAIEHAHSNFNKKLAASTLHTWMGKKENYTNDQEGYVEYHSKLRGRPIQMSEKIQGESSDKLEYFLNKGVHITFSVVK